MANVTYSSYRIETYKAGEKRRRYVYDARTEESREKARELANNKYLEGYKVTMYKLEKVTEDDGTSRWVRSEEVVADGRPDTKKSDASTATKSKTKAKTSKKKSSEKSAGFPAPAVPAVAASTSSNNKTLEERVKYLEEMVKYLEEEDKKQDQAIIALCQKVLKSLNK